MVSDLVDQAMFTARIVSQSQSVGDSFVGIVAFHFGLEHPPKGHGCSAPGQNVQRCLVEIAIRVWIDGPIWMMFAQGEPYPVHERPVFIDARRPFVWRKHCKALFCEGHFGDVVFAICYAVERQTLGVCPRIAADRAIPPVVMPRNPDRDVVCWQLSRPRK